MPGRQNAAFRDGLRSPPLPTHWPITGKFLPRTGLIIRTIYAALAPSGDVVFTIEHPIFMAAAHPHWIMDEDGRKTWPVNGYSLEGERRTDWFTKGVLKYHRTLETTISTLIDAGFELRRIKEFAPTSQQIAANPDLAEELERPMMLLVSARKR